jgi:hypothetical protein
LILKISELIVKAFDEHERKDAIRRLVYELESATHPRVSGGLVDGWLDDLDRTWGEHEETGDLTSAEEELARLRGEGV